MRGSAQRAAAAERFARYCELRDGGAFPADASREIGISLSTGYGYERAYREARGMPRRPPTWSR